MHGGRMLKLYVYLAMIIMLVPIIITFPVAVTTTGYMTFPPQGFTLKWFLKAFQDPILLSSMWRSVSIAVFTALISIAIGFFASYSVERHLTKGKNLIETIFTGPQMIPQIIFVLSLLIYYERIGLAQTYAGLLISHVIICLPFSFRTILVSVTTLDKRLEWSAEMLGANTFQKFFWVILPQVKTGMIASFIFTFIISFNNVTMALFLSGVGKKTLPVEMFHRLHIGGITPTIPAISFLLSIAGLVLFIIADRTIGIFKYLGGGEK